MMPIRKVAIVYVECCAKCPFSRVVRLGTRRLECSKTDKIVYVQSCAYEKDGESVPFPDWCPLDWERI
jgi:hypothetical protein